MYTDNSENTSLANSEDPDEMPHNAAFHQGLHYLLKLSSETAIQSCLEIITCDPLIYTNRDNFTFIVSKESISTYRVNGPFGHLKCQTKNLPFFNSVFLHVHIGYTLVLKILVPLCTPP